MSRYSFEQHPESPFLWVNIQYSGQVEKLQLHWGNTHLFYHRPEFKQYDHIFVQQPNENGEDYGTFIWRRILPDFQDLANALITHDFKNHHSPYPLTGDVEAYLQHYPEEEAQVTKDLARIIKAEKALGRLVLPEPQVIVEAEDDEVVRKAMEHIDAEIEWFFKEQE